jgi:hypothetical protein
MLEMRFGLLVVAAWVVACHAGSTAKGWNRAHAAKSQATNEGPMIDFEGLGNLRASCPPGTELLGPISSDGVMFTVNGRVAAECSKPDGSRHGPAAAWYANGSKASAGEHRDGMKEGLWCFWHENGQMSGRGVFRDGKSDGVWETWHDNGQKESEGSYRRGLHHGQFTHWDRDGKIVQVLHYDHGRLIGRVPYRDGKPISSVYSERDSHA